MMTQRFASVALLGLALAVTACGKKEEPVVQPPPMTSGGARFNQDSADAAARAAADRAAAEAARAAAAAAEAARAALVNEIAATINFEYDQFDIRMADRDKLTRKVAIMRANPALRIRIVGHADERGSDEYNLALGMRRAVAAKDFMVAIGIDASRVEVASLGEEVPLDPTATESAWAANRRDEFEIIAGGQSLVAPGN
jgi:peptidoglycan-associated lipoprotein